MMRRFERVAANENNEDWSELISREDELYCRDDDIRSQFARDYTRVLHSLAYRRLKHKTQVFFNAAGNDHICTRIEHVMHVESVSNTISKYLGLNEELTKTIAISHDLGHAPFGHQGEKVLNDISEKYLNKKFWHEQNGVYFVDNVELLEDNQRNLRNLSLTYAVRDGIISHCGEIDQNAIKPRKEKFNLNMFKEPGQEQAATWEGCVVKLADKIAYLGRDIEDAIRLNYLTKSQINDLQEMAGARNKDAINTTVIMHNMIIDLCKNSSPDLGLCLSSDMHNQLVDIKQFNYDYIYNNDRLKPYKKYSELVLTELTEVLISYYKGENTLEHLNDKQFYNKKFIKDFALWLMQYCDNEFSNRLKELNPNTSDLNRKIYRNLENEELYIQAVVDFIAGMTDNYAYESFEELLCC